MIASYLLAALIVVHIAGSLRHHFIKRNDVMRRMWFGSASGTQNVSPHAGAVTPPLPQKASARESSALTSGGSINHWDSTMKKTALAFIAGFTIRRSDDSAPSASRRSPMSPASSNS